MYVKNNVKTYIYHDTKHPHLYNPKFLGNDWCLPKSQSLVAVSSVGPGRISSITAAAYQGGCIANVVDVASQSNRIQIRMGHACGLRNHFFTGFCNSLWGLAVLTTKQRGLTKNSGDLMGINREWLHTMAGYDWGISFQVTAAGHSWCEEQG